MAWDWNCYIPIATAINCTVHIYIYITKKNWNWFFSKRSHHREATVSLRRPGKKYEEVWQPASMTWYDIQRPFVTTASKSLTFETPYQLYGVPCACIGINESTITEHVHCPSMVSGTAQKSLATSLIACSVCRRRIFGRVPVTKRCTVQQALYALHRA